LQPGNLNDLAQEKNLEKKKMAEYQIASLEEILTQAREYAE